MAREERSGKQQAEYNDDLPGGGQFYCVETGRHFTNQRALDAHKKTRGYKRRVKELRAERQFTQREAEWAAGMTEEELPSVRRRDHEMQLVK